VKTKCRNSPLGAWTTSVLAPGGSVDRSNAGYTRLTAAATGTVIIYDNAATKFNPSLKDFCMTVRIRSTLGNSSAAGIAVGNTFGNFLNVQDDGTNWSLTWTDGGGSTSHVLMPSDNAFHTFVVCKEGDTVTVQVDGGTLREYAVDANFPDALMNGYASAGDPSAALSQTDISQYCLTY